MFSSRKFKWEVILALRLEEKNVISWEKAKHQKKIDKGIKEAEQQMKKDKEFWYALLF